MLLDESVPERRQALDASGAEEPHRLGFVERQRLAGGQLAEVRLADDVPALAEPLPDHAEVAVQVEEVVTRAGEFTLDEVRAAIRLRVVEAVGSADVETSRAGFRMIRTRR